MGENLINTGEKILAAYNKIPSTEIWNVENVNTTLRQIEYYQASDVFESKENFDKWLLSENYFLDNKPPEEFLNTITGIQFIDDRLTAIEYGDNV